MIDEYTFRALARSSPWLWSRAEFDFADRSAYPVGPLHAVVERPGHTMITLPDGSRRELRQEPQGGAITVFGWSADRSEFLTPVPPNPLFAQEPDAPQPTWRDGLVSRRPDPSLVVTDDPMWQNYHWIAMLDPVELADGMDSEVPPDLRPDWPIAGTEILELNEEARGGRASVAAVLHTLPTYEPRCGCCALLPDERIYRFEYGDDDRHRPERWADAFRVVLDRETGICVSLRELGGSHDGDGFEVTLHEVTRWAGRPAS